MSSTVAHTCLLERDQIIEYAAISGSDGPAHIDDVFAAEHFGGLVVHGALLAEVMLSTVLREGLIQRRDRLQMDVRFRRIVLVGEEFGVWFDPDQDTRDGLEVRGMVDGAEAVVMKLHERDGEGVR